MYVNLCSFHLIRSLLIILLIAATSELCYTQIVVNSLADLKSYLDDDGVNVQLQPGTYWITEDDVNNGLYNDNISIGGSTSYGLLFITGSNNIFDFTGVTINIETGVFSAYGFQDQVYEVHITGNNNTLKNLTLVDVGDIEDNPSRGALSVCMDGEYNLVENFHMTVKGSTPYGYGDIFGKGGGAVISHRKHSACLIRGNHNHLKDCTIIHRAYGHGIFMQAANDAVIEGCYLEGELRTTDDVLAEEGTGSPADLVDFFTDWDFTLEPGFTFSLQEDGIRVYNAGNTIVNGVEYDRGTTNVTIIDNTVIQMRTGVVIGFSGGTKYVENCTVLACETGYWVGSGDVVNSFGDTSVGPLYAEDRITSNGNMELTVLDNYVQKHGDTPSFYLAGNNHDIEIHNGTTCFDSDIEIQVGGHRLGHRWQFGSPNEPPYFDANNLEIINNTNYPVLLGDNSFDNTTISCGSVDDNGSNNTILSNSSCVPLNDECEDSVDPLTNAGVISGGGTFCDTSAGTIHNFSSSSAPSGGCSSSIQYQWQYKYRESCESIYNDWSDWAGQISESASWNGHISRDYQFRRGARRVGCGDYIYSNTITVDIEEPLTSAGSISGGDDFCDSINPPNITNSGAASGGCDACGITYQWQSSTNGGSWSNITGATSATYDPSVITATTEYRRLAKRADCGDYLNSNVVIFSQSGTLEVMVSSNITQMCLGGTVNFTSSVSGGTGSCELQWQRRNASNAAWEDWTTSANPSLRTYFSAPGNNYQFRAIYDCDGASCGAATSNVVNVEVFVDPDISIEADDVAVCLGETVALSSTRTGGTGSCSVQWQRRPQGGTWADWTVSNNVSVGTGYLSAPGVYQFRAIYDCDGASCGAATSNVVNVEVYADPDITIESDLTNICVGYNAELTYGLSGGTGNCDVQWQRRPQGGTWQDFGNGESPRLGGINFLSTPGVYQYRATYDCDGASCGTATSNVINVEVFSDPTVTASIDDSQICIGEVVGFSSSVTGGIGCNDIQWEQRYEGGSWVDGATVANPSQVTFADGPGLYEYRVSYSCSGASCNTATSAVISLQVSVDPVISIASDKTEMCIGDNVELTYDLSGGTGSCSVQWQRRPQGGTWADFGNGESPRFGGINFLSTPGVYQYRALYDCDGASCGSATSNVINVEVIADPDITIESDLTNICVGYNAELTYGLSGGTGNCDVQWQRRPQGGIWADFGNGESPRFGGINFLSTPGVYQYRALYDCDGASCGAATSNVVNVEVFTNSGCFGIRITRN